MALVPPKGDAAAVTARVRAQIGKQAGREYPLEEFRRHNLAGTAQELVDAFGALEQAGVEYVTVYLFDVAAPETLDRFAEAVLPAFA